MPSVKIGFFFEKAFREGDFFGISWWGYSSALVFHAKAQREEDAKSAEAKGF
jgi:hypothetical protein